MKSFASLIIILCFNTQYLFANFRVERQIIEQHFLDYYLSYPPEDDLTEHYLNTMQGDGTWASVDYKSTRRGDWPTTDHVKYVNEMARSYAHPDSKFYKDKGLEKAILKGIQHWLDADYKNKNWYPIYIRAPRHVLKSFILLGDALPIKMKDDAWQKMFAKLHMRRKGSNQVIAAEVEMMKAIVYNKKEIMDKAVAIIWSEVRLTTKEGIQPDWCYHQHGNQQQLGNYGLSYSGRVTEWAYLLRNTSYALSQDKLEIHRNFLLNGPGWFLWKGKMDINAVGRQYRLHHPEQKFEAFTKQFVLMQNVDPEFKNEYQKRIEQPFKLTGHNAYWRTDFSVHREKDWMASLSMSSTRVIGTELCNMENFLGLHIGDGRLLVTRSGEEYEHIAPLWDWNRLSGTTCDQDLDTLTPQLKTRTKSNFAGVIGNGKSGVAAMHYKRDGLQAKKSWFFTKEGILCLGAGIQGQSKGNVITSVEQSNLKGTIHTSNGEITKEKTFTKSDAWVHHNHIGYHLLENATITTTYVKDNWQKCFPTYENVPAEGSVFSIYIDHGKHPNAQTYAYGIYPNVEAKAMDNKIRKQKTKIISNTAIVQAVRQKRCVMAVFYTSGKLVVDAKLSIEVDAPCLLMLDAKNISVADPVHAASSITIKLNEQSYIAKMPQGEQQGDRAILTRK